MWGASPGRTSALRPPSARAGAVNATLREVELAAGPPARRVPTHVRQGQRRQPPASASASAGRDLLVMGWSEVTRES